MGPWRLLAQKRQFLSVALNAVALNAVDLNAVSPFLISLEVGEHFLFFLKNKNIAYLKV